MWRFVTVTNDITSQIQCWICRDICFLLFSLSISLERLFVAHVLHSDCARTRLSTHSLTQFIFIYWSALVQVLFNKCLTFLRRCILFIFLFLFRFSLILLLQFDYHTSPRSFTLFTFSGHSQYHLLYVTGACSKEKDENKNKEKIPIHYGLNFFL